MQRTIVLAGHGEMRSPPDMAVVNVGVTSTAATAREALDANNKTMEALLAALRASGIEAKDVQTANFSVAPRYDYNQNSQPPKVVGYDVSNTVAATLRALDKLGPTLDKLVGLGSNQINGISFTIADPQPLQDAARKAAIADARRKAVILAEAAGVSLGDVMNISETGGYQPPVPVLSKAVRMDAAGAAPGSVPVAEGEQLVSADVTVTWAIK